jgi:hypothetical protein
MEDYHQEQSEMIQSESLIKYGDMYNWECNILMTYNSR